MHRLLQYRLSRVQCSVLFCIAIISGIAVAYFTVLEIPRATVLLVTVLPLFYHKRTLMAVVMIVIAGLLLGLVRGGEYYKQRAGLRSYIGKHETLIAVANTDSVYDARQQISFTATELTIDGQSFAGQAQVSGFGVNTVLSGDTVEVTGQVRNGFGSAQLSMGFAQLRVLRHQSNPITSLRREFAAGMQSSLPEPAASLGLGILIGQRSTLPKPVKNDLLMIGLTHIIAVSGYNLTIIIQSFRRMLKPLSKRSITYLSYGTIVVFLLITGSSASIIRAAIVSVLSIAAAYYGRVINPVLLVLLAAASTALINPYYIWGDASWYLSILAFFGILVLAPLLASRWNIKGLLLLLLIETLSAEVMTIPYILLTFSQISLLGLLANVVIVPLVPLAMLCSFVAGLAGMIVAPFAGWLSWPARICLTYILDASHLMARIHHTFLQHIQFSVLGVILLYALVVVWILALHYKTKRINHAKITDINLSQPTILAEETT